MSEQLSISVNGKAVAVPIGSTVAIAVALAGCACRRSVTGEPRSTLCGMGICFECRVTIDGVPHRRGCLILCEPGMDVMTNG
jgi:aerobic-type carbon monoxide dehydrogenase small subunit (CoxS/CutS family)